jgi:hypothetical protein
MAGSAFTPQGLKVLLYSLFWETKMTLYTQVLQKKKLREALSSDIINLDILELWEVRNMNEL